MRKEKLNRRLHETKVFRKSEDQKVERQNESVQSECLS